jgi:hypothetical protein
MLHHPHDDEDPLKDPHAEALEPFGVSKAQAQQECEDIHGGILFIRLDFRRREINTDAFIGESVVVILPAESSFNIST